MNPLKTMSLAVVLLSSSAVSAKEQTEMKDPLYGFNKAMFCLNNVFDRAVFEPAAWTYNHVLPPLVRGHIGNVFFNLREPLHFFNNLAQKNRGGANNSFKRFIINTTLGFGGIFDIASKMGFEKSRATLDESLTKWGVHTGPYLFLPIFGPTNPRHMFSKIVESAAHPLGVVSLATGERAVGYAWKGSEGLHDRAEAYDSIKKLRESSLNYYTSVKSVVGQKWLSRSASQSNTLYDQDFDLIEGNKK